MLVFGLNRFNLFLEVNQPAILDKACITSVAIKKYDQFRTNAKGKDFQFFGAEVFVKNEETGKLVALFKGPFPVLQENKKRRASK